VLTALLGTLPRTRSPAKKGSRSKEEAEVVPASRIWKCINSDVGKDTPDKTEDDYEAVPKPRKESRWVIRVGYRLVRATHEQKGGTDNRQKPGHSVGAKTGSVHAYLT
jgi:hypothetical protein